MIKKENNEDWNWMNCQFNLRKSVDNKDILWNLSPIITLSHPYEEVIIFKLKIKKDLNFKE